MLVVLVQEKDDDLEPLAHKAVQDMLLHHYDKVEVRLLPQGNEAEVRSMRFVRAAIVGRCESATAATDYIIQELEKLSA